MPEPILVDDGLERWQVNPGDNFYEQLSKLKPDENGVRHTTAEISEGHQTWWWRTAIEKANKLKEQLAIPWEEFNVDEDDITNSNLTILSEKLAKISYYIIQINNMLSLLMSVQVATKEALDHAVNRILAKGDDVEEGGRKPAIDARRALIISRDKRLRNTKIEFIESSAAIKALEPVRESLEVAWKTISRILSARFQEPIDR